MTTPTPKSSRVRSSRATRSSSPSSAAATVTTTGRRRRACGCDAADGRQTIMAEPIIRLEHVTRTYHVGDVDVHALQDVSLTIDKGEFVAIMGHSGSGKSTLMAVLGCLDRPTSGRYFFEGTDVAGLEEPERASSAQRTARLRVPELQSARPHQRDRKRGAAAVLCRHRAGQRHHAHRAGARRPDAARPGRPRAQHARPTLRRPAAAGGDRARPDQQPGPAARRRADRQSRYPHLARDHGDADQAQSRAGRHHRRRHPRSRHRRICRPRLDDARRRGDLRQAQSKPAKTADAPRTMVQGRDPSVARRPRPGPALPRAPTRPGPSG